MPWTAEQFKTRHWKDATPGQAKKAAAQASAMLRGGASESVAIATAIKTAKAKHHEKFYGSDK